MEKLLSDQNIYKTIRSDIIIRKQYVLSTIIDSGPEIVCSRDSSLIKIDEIVHSIKSLSHDVVSLFEKVEVRNEKYAEYVYRKQMIAKIECIMSCYLLKDILDDPDMLLDINDEEWYGRVFYFKAATDTTYDGSRLSNANFLFSNQILEAFSLDNLFGVLLRYGFVFSQVVALSYAHVWNVVHAIRARDLLYKNENIYLPIRIYIDREFCANYHLLKSLEKRHSIELVDAWSLCEDIAKIGDHVSLLLSHKIMNKYGVRTQIGPVATDLTKGYYPSRLFFCSGTDEVALREIEQNGNKEPHSLNIGLHVRTDEYKSQIHHSYRNGDMARILNPLIKALQAIKVSSLGITIWIFGYYGNIDKMVITPSCINIHVISNNKSRGLSYGEEDIYDMLDILIGTTSGPAHITNALGVPTLFLESTNLYGGDLMDTRSATSLKAIKGTRRWFALEPKTRSLLIKSDWSTGLLNYCNVYQHSPWTTEIIIKDYIRKYLGITNNFYLIGDALGEYEYGSAIDNSNIDEYTYFTIGSLLR